MRFLVKVAAQSESNRMQASNLAIVFGPTLVRPEVDTMEIAMMFDVVNRVIERLILFCVPIFADALPPPEETGGLGSPISIVASKRSSTALAALMSSVDAPDLPPVGELDQAAVPATVAEEEGDDGPTSSDSYEPPPAGETNKQTKTLM